MNEGVVVSERDGAMKKKMPFILFTDILFFVYGAITRNLDPSRWIPNLSFALWPLYFLRRFLRAG